MSINKVTVLGAGLMGSQIAGHLVGCGFDVLLLDLEMEFVVKGLERLGKTKPPAMYDNEDIRSITPGNFKDNLKDISSCDWVIEAIVEDKNAKHALYAEIEKHLNAKTVISSNTSGLTRASLIAGRSATFCKKFIVTHFFNPVRYMKLVEIVSGEENSKEMIAEISRVLEDRLGKGVVYSKDIPDFVANRIGVFTVLSALGAVEKFGWRVEVVDQVMGIPTCRPKSATFRTLDIVGLDTFVHVAKNGGHKLPAFVEEMMAKGWFGDKAGQGFYKKTKSEILVLDPKTMEYRPQQKIKTASLGLAKDMTDAAERIRTVVFADDEAGNIAWHLVSAAILFSLNVWREIAHSEGEVDKAMRWGFNWELGPFEQLRALGVTNVEKRLGRKLEDVESPKNVPGFLGSWVPKIASNAGADLLDIGDGIFCCSFHTKMNAIDADVVTMLGRSIEHVEKEGAGLVIGNNAANFSAGANLMMIFLAAQNKEFGQIEKMVRSFQNINQMIRFALKPVVVVPAGLTLGGGCEIALSAARIVAAAETYIGLVEGGVGLIPAGGGCKNLLLKFMERRKMSGPFPAIKGAFETIAFAKASSSAKEAKKIGYLATTDEIIIDHEKAFAAAKLAALALTKNYVPPAKRQDIILPGLGGKMALVNGVRQAVLKGVATEYDAFVSEKLAHVLCDGDMPCLHDTNEDHILELEREAFLSLCGEKKTLDRIGHMLSTGKPLRN